jgi:hypothetical protein
MPKKTSRTRTLFYNAVWSYNDGDRTHVRSQRFKRSGAYVSQKNDNPEGLKRVAEKLLKGYILGTEKKPGKHRNAVDPTTWKPLDIEILPNFHAESGKEERVCCVTFHIRYRYSVKEKEGHHSPGNWKTGDIQIGPEYKFLKPSDGQAYVQQRAQQWVNGVMSGEITLRVDYEAELRPVNDDGEQTWEVHQVSVVPIDPKDKNPIRQMKMKKSAPMVVNYKFIDSEGSGEKLIPMENVCVPTYLLERIEKRANLSKGKIGSNGQPLLRGWPTSASGEKCPNTVLAITQWMLMQDPGEGVSVEMMHNFCRTFNLPYYAFDFKSSCISRYPDDTGAPQSKNGEVMMFWVKDSHIYPITDRTMRHSLRQKAVDGDEGFAASGLTFECEEDDEKQGKEGEDKKKKKRTVKKRYFEISMEKLAEVLESKEHAVVYYDVAHKDLDRVYTLFREKTGVIPLVEINTKRIQVVKSEHVVVELVTEPRRAEKIAAALGVEYKGQSFGALGWKFLTTHFGFPMSSYSDQARKLMDDGTIPRSPVNLAVRQDEGGVWHYYSGKTSKTAPNQDLCLSLDFKSCYPSNIPLLRSDFPVLMPGDNPEPATEMSPSDGPCFYIVSVPDKVQISPLWMGNAAYDRDVIQSALDAGTDFKITGKIRASQFIPKDFFNRALDKLRELLPEKDRKTVENSLVGFFGIHKDTTGVKSYHTNDHSMMSYVVWSVIETMEKRRERGDVWVEDLPGDTGYAVHCTKEKQKLQDHRTVHAKILQHTYIRLYELIRDMQAAVPGAELVQVKTDSVTFEFPDKESLTRAKAYALSLEPQLKRENYKPLKNPRPIRKTEPVTIVQKRWNKTVLPSNEDCTPEYLLRLDGASIDSSGGKGKSEVIKWLSEHCHKNDIPFLVTSYTNAVANKYSEEAETFKDKPPQDNPFKNNPGRTLHAAFFKKGRPCKVFIIDEVSQVPQSLWAHIMAYKKAHPDTKFYFFGDFRQLPPVEPLLQRVVSMEDNLTLMELSHCNRLDFLKNWRFSDADAAVFDELYDDPSKLPAYRDRFGGSDLQQRSIVPTHWVRKRVNQVQMQEVEDSGTPGEWLERKARSNGKCQPMYLHEGLPLISNARCNKLGIKQRNATYKVASFDAENVILTPWCFFSGQVRSGGVLTLPRNVVAERFAVAYAITIHVAQGATIRGKYTVYNPEKFDRHTMYTALSRCTDIRNIHFCTMTPPLLSAKEKIALADRLKKNLGQIYGKTWMEYLEGVKLPANWTWWDYGLDFEIDHKVSRKDLKDDDVEKLNHWTNLRPLSIRLNRQKKACSDHMPDEIPGVIPIPGPKRVRC